MFSTFVRRKKVTAAFDDGLISSDGGLVLLSEAQSNLGLAEMLAGCIRDRRNQTQVSTRWLPCCASKC